MSSSRCLASRRGLLLSLLMVSTLGSGCGLPEYRLQIGGIPATASKLLLSVYEPPTDGKSVGTVSSEQPEIELKQPKSAVSTTVNLKDDLAAMKTAVFAAVACDSSGNIVATGSSQPAAPSAWVADVPLTLMPPTYPDKAKGRCTANSPAVMEITRQEQGVLGKTDFRLAVDGWSFLPSDQVTITSRILVPETQCDAPCRSQCTELVSVCNLGAIAKNERCYTDCQMTSQVELASAGRLYVRMPETENQIPTVTKIGADGLSNSISFATIKGSPFRVTVARKGGMPSAVLTEVQP